MSGTPKLMVQLLFGSGLRLMECLRLRIKDVDFSNRQIIVRDGKGENDRSVPLIFMRVYSSVPSKMPSAWPKSISLSVPILFAIPSLPIFLRVVTISARSRNYWVTRMSRPR